MRRGICWQHSRMEGEEMTWTRQVKTLIEQHGFRASKPVLSRQLTTAWAGVSSTQAFLDLLDTVAKDMTALGRSRSEAARETLHVRLDKTLTQIRHLAPAVQELAGSLDSLVGFIGRLEGEINLIAAGRGTWGK